MSSLDKYAAARKERLPVPWRLQEDLPGDGYKTGPDIRRQPKNYDPDVWHLTLAFLDQAEKYGVELAVSSYRTYALLLDRISRTRIRDRDNWVQVIEQMITEFWDNDVELADTAWAINQFCGVETFRGLAQRAIRKLAPEPEWHENTVQTSAPKTRKETPMNIGSALVSTVLRTGKIRPFIDAGMDRAWLKTTVARAIITGNDHLAYEDLLEYYAEHGKVSTEVFQKNYPAYRLAKAEWTPAEVLDIVRKETSAGALRPRKPGEAESLTDIDFGEFINSFTEQGIPFGITELDDAYGGGRPGQLITIVGRKASTKSTLMAWSAMAAWEHGFEVLFCSAELDTRQKLYSIGAHVSPERMRRGPGRDPRSQAKWEEEKARARAFFERTQGDGVEFHLAQQHSRFTVKDVAHDIDKYRPHAVYIDSFAYMEDAFGESAASYKAAENIATDLKLLAMEKGVTVYVSVQAQERQQGKSKSPGIEARAIQGSTGLMKASDLVLGIDTVEANRVFVNQIHNRYGDIDPIEIRWDWETMEMKVSEVDFDSFDL